MVSLTDIPPEVILRIFLQLPAEDCFNLANTCKFTYQISKIEFLWDTKIREDYGINVKDAGSSGPSSRAFYRHVLSKYGKLLGIWQATTYGHYGGLFQVSILLKYFFMYFNLPIQGVGKPNKGLNQTIREISVRTFFYA